MPNKDSKLLQDIQERLENLWPLIDFYNSHAEFSDYSAPVLEAARTVELMIVLLAYEKGDVLEHGRIVSVETKTSLNNKWLPPLMFACNGYLKGIPKEILDFLQIIRRHRNKAAHAYKVSYGEAVIFAEAFDCFVGWFVISSATLKHVDAPSKLMFLSHIGSLGKRMTIEVKTEHSETKEHVLTSIIPKAKQVLESGADTKQTNVALLAKLNVALDMLGQINSGVIQIDKKVDRIADKLDEISKQIGDYQSLVTRQIGMATSEDEIERIISAYADECTDRIVRNVNSQFAEQAYGSEKAKLLLSIGESAWNKLDSSSQNFLITAKITYNRLVNMDEIIDYSGVCLLVTKAVEVEMNNRFGRDYLAFLKEKYPGKDNFSQFPTALLNKYGAPIKPKEFTLGSVAHVLCYSVAKDITPEQVENNRRKLMEFLSIRLMTGQPMETIAANVELIAENVEEIRTDYRNPSAHTNELRCINAKQCFDLVLDVEKFLKKFLDSVDY